jgi:hypothetical protein
MLHAARVTTILLAAGLGACASVEPAEVSIPDRIRPGANESLAAVVPAKGVQIYECRASTAQPGSYEWAFVAPDAVLFDTRGNRIGQHYAGPHWEAADGSKVVASVKDRSDAPAAGAIPWLLLSAKSVGPEGSFSKVTSIVRANTVGGVAPASGCSQAAAGTSARVEYTADYYFYDVKSTAYNTGSRY